jgi:hypothetical protein
LRREGKKKEIHLLNKYLLQHITQRQQYLSPSDKTAKRPIKKNKKKGRKRLGKENGK